MLVVCVFVDDVTGDADDAAEAPRERRARRRRRSRLKLEQETLTRREVGRLLGRCVCCVL